MIEELESQRGLGWLLGIPIQQLRHLARAADRHYRPFTIPKGEKKRQIDNPKDWLKGVQRVLRKRVLAPEPVDPSVRACVKGGSPLKHARAVTGFKNVAETDLKDCYPSITDGMAFRLYRSLGFGVENSKILTLLTTWKGHLPQGAPTSDLVANLVLRSLDEKANAIAHRHGLIYSRCMDGFVFAGDDTRKALGLVIEEILKSGLAVRAKKTRNAGRGKEQIVAGYNVNTPFGAKVRNDKVQQIRTLVFDVTEAHRSGQDVTGRMPKVFGSLAYLRPTNRGVARRLEQQLVRVGLPISTKRKS